jgi:hypothetical protein
MSVLGNLADLHKTCGKPCGKNLVRAWKTYLYSELPQFEQLSVQFS